MEPQCVEMWGGPRDGELVPLYVLPYPHEVLMLAGKPPVLDSGGSTTTIEFARYLGPYRHPGREHLRYEFAGERTSTYP